MDIVTLQVLVVILIATMIRSMFGFGEALIAVPLLAFLIPLKIAAPLAVLISITIAATVVVQDWNKIHLRSTCWLVFASLLGTPFGLLLLTMGDGRFVKIGLAIFIIAFAVYSLSGWRPKKLDSDRWGWLLGCGFCAGVLGGAYGMNGPPLVIYGTIRRWSPQHFRATLQGYFLPASVIGMAGYWLSGLWVPMVTHYYLLSLPVVIPVIFLGRNFNQRMEGEAFLKYAFFTLIGVGILLFIQTCFEIRS